MLQELKSQNRYDEDSDSSQLAEEGQRTLNQGIWQEEQVLKFMVFSSFNVNVLASKLQRRTTKVFKQMANFIGTRSSTQCRSQNQKLIKKYKNIQRILKVYEMQMGKNAFENACKAYSKELKAMQIGVKRGQTAKKQNYISVFTQTEFSNDSGSIQKDNIKVEQQGAYIVDHTRKQLKMSQATVCTKTPF